jgi:hypothetical protein
MLRRNMARNINVALQGAPKFFCKSKIFQSVRGGAAYLLQNGVETIIRFGLPTRSAVTIKIFDLAGHEVATLLERAEFPAGRYQRVWDGRDAQGRAVTSGVYFYQLRAGSFVRTMKMVVVR